MSEAFSKNIKMNKLPKMIPITRKLSIYEEKNIQIDIRLWTRESAKDIIYFSLEDFANTFGEIDQSALIKDKHYIEISLISGAEKKLKTLLTYIGVYSIIPTLEPSKGELAHRYIIYTYSRANKPVRTDKEERMEKYKEIIKEYEEERKKYEEIIQKAVSEDIYISLERENEELHDELAELRSKVNELEEKLDTYARAIKISSAKKILVSAKKYKEIRERYNIDQDIINSLSMEDEEMIMNDISSIAAKNTIPSRKKKYELYRRFLRKDPATDIDFYEWELVPKASEPRHQDMIKIGFISLSEERRDLFNRWCEMQQDGLSEVDITCFEKQTPQYYGEYDRKTYKSDQRIRTAS